MRVVMIGLGTLALTAAAPPDAAPVLPGWLTGCWVEERGAEWTEECWTTPRAGLMLGSGRSGGSNGIRSWETMQILRDEVAPSGERVALAFWGAPLGQVRTLFRWRTDGGPGVSFYNEAHDYPQRIRYWRDGKFLMAETALADGGKAQR